MSTQDCPLHGAFNRGEASETSGDNYDLERGCTCGEDLERHDEVPCWAQKGGCKIAYDPLVNPAGLSIIATELHRIADALQKTNKLLEARLGPD